MQIPNLLTLRKRAELKLEEEVKHTSLRNTPRSVFAPDADHLLNELRVHQIELELQNEALRHTCHENAQSRDEYFEIFELAPVSYVRVDASGAINEANLTASGLLGVSRGQLCERTLASFVSEDSLVTYHHTLRGAFEKVRRQGCELQLDTAHEEPVWVWLEIHAIEDHSDSASRSGLVTLYDISQRKNLERDLALQKARLRALSNAIQDAIVMFDALGRVESCNPIAERMFGYSMQEMVRRDASLFLSSVNGGSPLDQITALGRDGDHADAASGRDVVGLRRDGRRFPMRLSLSDVELEDRRVYCAVMRDLSRQPEPRSALARGELDPPPDDATQSSMSALAQRTVEVLPPSSRARSDARSARDSPGTVLVVDDYEHVLKPIKMYLELEGWKVLTASNELEALATCRENAHVLDALLIDYELPTRSGDALAREVAEIVDGIAIAYMSGYANLTLEPAGPALLKPLDMCELSSTLMRLLEDTSRQPDSARK